MTKKHKMKLHELSIEGIVGKCSCGDWECSGASPEAHAELEDKIRAAFQRHLEVVMNNEELSV